MGETQLRLWPFSLAVYHDDDVQKECLDLQDRHGIDVNMLLFCAFVGAVHGAIISERDVKDALSLIGAWNANVGRALRKVRRELKLFADPSPIQIAAGELRTSVNAAAPNIQPPARYLPFESSIRMKGVMIIRTKVRRLGIVSHMPEPI